jgi:hypothetical protein
MRQLQFVNEAYQYFSWRVILSAVLLKSVSTTGCQQVLYSNTLLCLDVYSITFMIIHRTKPTDKLQFQTYILTCNSSLQAL